MDDNAPLSDQDARVLRFLKVLVTVLAATMIAGVLTIVVLLVIRLQPDDATPLPNAIVLPSGAEALAFTQGPDWYAVVTRDNKILIYSRATGALRQELTIQTQGE
ncbi:MAG: DUF6476 family protein [Pseudomonadota bacterium]